MLELSKKYLRITLSFSLSLAYASKRKRTHLLQNKWNCMNRSVKLIT